VIIPKSAARTINTIADTASTRNKFANNVPGVFSDAYISGKIPVKSGKTTRYAVRPSPWPASQGMF
jgi:hypothetical protein